MEHDTPEPAMAFAHVFDTVSPDDSLVVREAGERCRAAQFFFELAMFFCVTSVSISTDFRSHVADCSELLLCAPKRYTATLRAGIVNNSTWTAVERDDSGCDHDHDQFSCEADDNDFPLQPLGSPPVDECQWVFQRSLHYPFADNTHASL